MRLCSAQEMAAMDRHAIIDQGLPGVVLMENAGRACCRIFEDAFRARQSEPVLIVCGKGNNGGDGYVMARILADQGWCVRVVVLAAEEDITGDAAIMLRAAQALGICFHFISESALVSELFEQLQPGIIVDAIFGTGLRSAVCGLQRDVIELINSLNSAVFAVDIPSGVDGSTGRICAVAVRAAVTVTFAHAKIGHGSQPGAACCGELFVVDIGIPLSGRREPESQVHLLDAQLCRKWLPDRPRFGHKGSFGHCLLIAGSPGKTGAAALAGNAAVRSGCGLVTVATAASLHDIIEVKLTEAMSLALPEDAGGHIDFSASQLLDEYIDTRQALAVGPGLGQSKGLQQLLRWLLGRAAVPLVIDADGLNLLASQPHLLKVGRRAALVLTPHPGEMARLCGLSVAEIEADRFEVAREFAVANKVTLLLKGPRTLIAAADGRVNINSSGNDALATGGSGDVLTGLIGGLLAQGLEPFAAASLGAWLHGRAAELVAGECGSAGMAASDLLTRLPLARRELQKGA